MHMPRAVWTAALLALAGAAAAEEMPVNRKDDGYRGIWYMNQPSGDAYVFKYSGGLGTYCAKHRPLAVYCPAGEKTFFCYGGTAEGAHPRHTPDDLSRSGQFDRRRPGFLLHMVSYFDHKTGLVPRPTILLDKETADAHDNPVISVDDRGFLWIFSTSHGTSRPSFIHRSTAPWSIDAFERVPATRSEGGRDVPITNFSYMQAWHVPGRGFLAFFTQYNFPVTRTSCFMTSPDGVRWSAWQRLAAFGEGHYQVSEPAPDRAGVAFNYHPPKKGVNGRTNLYYLDTPDGGASWRTAGGRPVEVPLATVEHPALVRDYAREGLNVYMKDLAFDRDRRPVILYVTSAGYEPGPENGPRVWTTARWAGSAWEVREGMRSDNNYDTGALHIEEDGTWRVIGPTEPGPQPFNPGGEMAMWTSDDRGATWKKARQMTSGSERNHTYARRPVNAHPGFYALWADGHGRQPSASRLYFCDKAGTVYLLPPEMRGEFDKPSVVK